MAYPTTAARASSRRVSSRRSATDPSHPRSRSALGSSRQRGRSRSTAAGRAVDVSVHPTVAQEVSLRTSVHGDVHRPPAGVERDRGVGGGPNASCERAAQRGPARGRAARATGRRRRSREGGRFGPGACAPPTHWATHDAAARRACSITRTSLSTDARRPSSGGTNASSRERRRRPHEGAAAAAVDARRADARAPSARARRALATARGRRRGSACGSSNGRPPRRGRRPPARGGGGGRGVVRLQPVVRTLTLFAHVGCGPDDPGRRLAAGPAGAGRAHVGSAIRHAPANSAKSAYSPAGTDHRRCTRRGLASQLLV